MTRVIRSTIAVLAAAALHGHAGAAPGTGFDLAWHTVDGGGGTCDGAALTLSSTTGQPDAGVAMTGGAFSLTGGFWAASGVEAAPPCPGDLDGSGDVAFADLLAVLSTWGPCPACPTDLDGDGSVGFADLLAVLSTWGPCPE